MQHNHYKNSLNFYHGRDDFGVDAKWTFFVTSFEKSHYGITGICGKMKPLVVLS